MNFPSHGESAGRDKQGAPLQLFEEPHYPVAYWAQLWGFSRENSSRVVP